MVPRPEAEIPKTDFTLFGELVAAAFQQRRKTLRNAVSAFLDEAGIEAAGVSPTARAETLGVNEFVRLANEAVRRRSTQG